MSLPNRTVSAVLISGLAIALAACHNGPPGSSTTEVTASPATSNPDNPITGAFEPVAPGKLAKAKQVGDCNVDSVNGQIASNGAPLDHQGAGQFAGWLGDRVSGKAPPDFQLVLTGASDYAVKGVTGAARPDVASATGVPGFATSGYQLNASMSAVPVGSYGVTLVYQIMGEQMACATKVHVTVE